MTSSFTTNFRFEIPDFNTKPWHAILQATLRRIDQVIYNALSANADTYAVSTAYAVGEIVIDPADGSLWICLVSHTSDDTDTFAQARVANPTYWRSFNPARNYRQAWQNATAYIVGDIIYDPDTALIAECITSHTSSAGPATILDDLATYWEVIADFTLPDDSSNISYDNTISGLSATSVKAALDEIVAEYVAADALLAPKANPTFTGTPSAPTAAYGTNTTQVATTAHVRAETRRAAQTLTDGASVALDASLGKIFSLTAAGDRTILAPTGSPYDGQAIVIRHIASGGSRTLTLTTGSAGAFRYTSDVAALSATASGKTDYIGCIYHSTDDRWDVISYVKGA